MPETPGDPPPQVEFRTAMISFGRMLGDPGPGVVMDFITHDGPTFRTLVGPQLAAQVAGTLLEVLASMPTPPEIPASGMPQVRVPGPGHVGDTVEYFGQQYRPDILQAFGVLMIRANLLDVSLIKLSAAVSRTTIARAAAAYHATQNFKARVDGIRAVVPLSGLSDDTQEHIADALELATRAAGRRNDLVHASWEFAGDHFIARTYKPNTKKQVTELRVTARSILEIAEAYRSAGERIEVFTAVAASELARSIAQNASDTPSSGEPSS